MAEESCGDDTLPSWLRVCPSPGCGIVLSDVTFEGDWLKGTVDLSVLFRKTAYESRIVPIF